MDISTWFLTSTITGFTCIGLALVVVVSGWIRQLPEVAILGSGLVALSVFATGFGLSVTSLGGGPTASPLVAYLALPAAVASTYPLLFTRSALARWISHVWQTWVTAACLGSTLIATLAMQATTTVPVVLGISLVGIGVSGSLLLVRRQLFLYRTSRSRSALTTTIAISALTLSAAANLITTPGDNLSWLMLAVENTALLAAAGAIIIGYRSGKGVAEILRPLLSTEPLAALEVGMSPEVHGFVAALECRDTITRDHVVRTSALAMRIAIRAELPSQVVREVALGALLHDIGKLVVPSDIIKKPGGLTDEEFAVIKTHPEQGERLLENAPALSGAAKYVRGHHERVDGKGYPDHLCGDKIPLAVGIVSACDAWDAMTHTRQYRQGMGAERATEILQAGAGTQWRSDAVLLLLAEVKANGQSDLLAAGPIGRHSRPAPLDQPALRSNLSHADLQNEPFTCCDDVVGKDLHPRPQDPATPPTAAGTRIEEPTLT